MTIDWAEIGKFISSVGVPTAVLMLIAGPIVFALYKFISVFGPKIAQAHADFMETAAKSNERNADTLDRLEQVIAQKHDDHTKTHRALSHAAEAGINMLDGRHEDARKKLTQIEEILKGT